MFRLKLRTAITAATMLAATAAVAIALAGCGTARPTTSQLRNTVEQYLTARTPLQRCELYTTVYRTMNPTVIFAGGCERSEQITPAEQAALRALRIVHVDVRNGHATVALRPTRKISSADPTNRAELTLTELDLTIEHGDWRINGMSASGQETAVARG
jgi:hypothetical protein